MNSESVESLVSTILTDDDYELESTAQSPKQFEKLLQHVDVDHGESVLVDIGCGAGAFTRVVQAYLDIPTVHGVDVNTELLTHARKHGIITHERDVQTEPLPFDDSSVDIVLCLGVLEHLREYDTLLEEIKRILCEGGVAIFAVPNLGSWVNRISLLGGWQPRNIEITNKRPVAAAPWYGDDDEVLDHIHAPTFKGFYEVLELHGYTVETAESLFPYQENIAVKFIDTVTIVRPQLARRFGVVARPN